MEFEGVGQIQLA